MQLIERAMLTAASVDETAASFAPGTNDSISPNGYTHIVEWGTGVASGVVEIEGSHDASYAGTWANIHTFTYAAGSPKQEYVSSAALFPVYRHRISTVIGGGTVTTKLVGAV